MAGDILRQMLKPARSLSESDPAVDGLAGVLGKAASVSGLSALEVQLEAGSRAARQVEPADFVAGLPENGLFYRLECDTEEQIGLLALGPDLVNSIADVLTGGLEKGADKPARPPTDIDAALCRPFMDAMFLEFADILRDLRRGNPTDTYRTARTEKAPSPHLFPEIPYLEIGIDFDFMGGAGNGHLSLMLPAANTEFTSTLPRPGESASAWRAALKQALDDAPAVFDAVLYRKTMPVGRILKLKPGDVLEVPARALENLSIESRKGKTRQSLMRARLGEYQEMRAAKITRIGQSPPSGDGPKLLQTPPAEEEAPTMP